MNIVRKEIKMADGRVITLETGKLAKQAILNEIDEYIKHH